MGQLTIRMGEQLRQVQVEDGARLSEALVLHGAAPDMPCGGKGRCGKCRVKACGQLTPLTAEERSALSDAEIAEGVRLACCTRLLGDAEVCPADDRAVSQICAVGTEREVALDPMFTRLGAAMDIGTTTLAAHLYDQAGQIAAAAAPNPQRDFGADVITRVGSAMEGSGAALAACVRKAVAALLANMCMEANRRTEEIDSLVITGNTAMLHLLLGEDPSPLAAAPFEARELFGKTVAAETLDLPCAPHAQVYLPRCMSAFVGGDITTALLASGICDRDETALLVDIGTNGEMALWHKGKLRCCSTAAGPAFEGANLSQGMQGAPGAIDHAWVQDGAVAVHTIGDVPAIGICGSGVADVLACLLELGKLDETGLLDDGEEDAWPLAAGVSFTQQDIRQVQLAKSAIRAGMETLLQNAGLTAADVAHLAVAGGFGSYLSLESASRIGLLPGELVSRSSVLGNAALSGAAMLLRGRGLQKESEAMAESAVTVDLSTDPTFMEQYIEGMMF